MIVVDSNVWIFAENENADEHAIAAQRVRQWIATEGFAINPMIVTEVFHVLSRLLGLADAGRRVINIMRHPSAEWFDYRSTTLQAALKLAMRCDMRINDALIAQQALERRSAILTNNVKDFKKVKGLAVIPLR